MSLSSRMAGHSSLVEMKAKNCVPAMVFTTNGECLVNGGDGVQVWRAGDGKEVASIANVPGKWGISLCLAVSPDGKWIAGGTILSGGAVFVLDAKTYRRAFTFTDHQGGDTANTIFAVDFSPDSTRLVSGVGTAENGIATVWDIATRKQVQNFDHQDSVFMVKYSPQGDRIATATRDLVRVWESSNGSLLVDINASVSSEHNGGLLWLNNFELLVLSEGKIKQFDASTGSPLSEWSFPDSSNFACIAMPKHREFIVCSTKHTVTFWDTSTHSQLALIEDPEGVHQSIALSPDDRFLAIGNNNGDICIKMLSRITGSIPSLSPPHLTLQEPDIWIDDVALDAWKNDQLADAEALLTTAIEESRNPSHHVLASRALVRARLQQWNTAIADAEMAIDAQQSVIGYIAKAVAHVGKGERHKGYRACDIALERFHSSHTTFLLLIKAIVVFMAREHDDAISRVDDLIATVHHNSICHIVQAYMYLLLGNSHLECNDYEGAIHSFEHAQAQMRDHESRSLMVISLISGWKFDGLYITILRRLCESLYAHGRTKDAVECFHQMSIELKEMTNLDDEHVQWTLDFKRGSCGGLEHLGDTAVDAQRHDEAITIYTMALSLNPPSSLDILIKRCKVFVATKSWKQAADDADQVIALDPLSLWGYEIKYKALREAGEYDSAADALDVMLSKMAESRDPDIRWNGDQHIRPPSIRATIRKIVQKTIRHLPRVLINMTTGRLYNKAEQASAFESEAFFKEFVSSMMTRINYVRIKCQVRQYFLYVMLSHRWEENEPLFQQMVHLSVYDLEESPTHKKLQRFCKIVQDARFKWAWSDTCCIDRSDHFILQEALVAMFKWYQGSALVIVFLRGVRSSSQRGALMRSIWNTRAWTLQEYVAAKVIHFYTEDWTLYLNLELTNHKESPEIISEMEQATGVSAQQLMTLHSGLTSIREKLRLASTRQTTLIEDAAYSLLGIFSVTGLPAIYGEGEGSLGRLLAHVLAGSGDVSILAWTGESGSYNSCLPAHITVFNEPATSHLPSLIADAEMEEIVTSSHTPSFDLDAALRLYDRLNELPPPWFAASRMKLPCIAFQLPTLTLYRTRSGRVYRADTAAFGMVEINTQQDLSKMNTVYLIHPWLETILDREDIHDRAFIEDETILPPSPNMDDEAISDGEIDADISSLAEAELSSHPTPVCMNTVPIDREMQARRLVARLRQPFGALLIALASMGRRAVVYRRVAADSLITVQFREDVSLADILDNVRTLDVL